MQMVKDKERILKAAREKQLSYLKGSFHKTVCWFLNRNSAGQKGLAGIIQSNEKQGPTTKITLPGKAIV